MGVRESEQAIEEGKGERERWRGSEGGGEREVDGQMI